MIMISPAQQLLWSTDHTGYWTNPTLTKRPKYMKPILQYYLGCTEKPSQQPEEIQALAKELAEKESNANNIETNFMDMYMSAWLMAC